MNTRELIIYNLVFYLLLSLFNHNWFILWTNIIWLLIYIGTHVLGSLRDVYDCMHGIECLQSVQ